MTSILTFESNVYSEELFAGISKADYNEVMASSAVDDGWQGYSEWSQQLESGFMIVAESENFIAYSNGTVGYRTEPKSNGRLEGIDL